jgi:hypothetical protein
MKKIVLVPFFAILLAGCNEIENKSQAVSESFDCKSNLSKWLRECTYELAKNQPNEVQWFNSIGANEATFMPVSNPTEEIFQKCHSIQPLSDRDVPVYKKCLEDCISEIQSINQSDTREEVNKLLQQNGGISTPEAAIYSHSKCEVLKVRIEFVFQKDKDGRAKFDKMIKSKLCLCRI